MPSLKVAWVLRMNIVFVDAEQRVEGANRRNGRLADADGADLRRFDHRDLAVAVLQHARQRAAAIHPAVPPPTIENAADAIIRIMRHLGAGTAMLRDVFLVPRRGLRRRAYGSRASAASCAACAATSR